jgi:hypothetical protein
MGLRRDRLLQADCGALSIRTPQTNSRGVTPSLVNIRAMLRALVRNIGPPLRDGPPRRATALDRFLLSRRPKSPVDRRAGKSDPTVLDPSVGKLPASWGANDGQVTERGPRKWRVDYAPFTMSE